MPFREILILYCFLKVISERVKSVNMKALGIGIDPRHASYRTRSDFRRYFDFVRLFIITARVLQSGLSPAEPGRISTFKVLLSIS